MAKSISKTKSWKESCMGVAKPGFLFVVAIFAVAGCKHQVSDADAVRAGIVEHLTSLKSLNLSAMDINVTSVNIQGNHAQAQVEFHPKSGAPSDAGMQVSYSLDKQDANWVVTKTLATGGVIEHPSAGANPHVQGGPAGDPGVAEPPLFPDLLHRGASQPAASGALPPGHPRVGSAATAPEQSAKP
jgi:hypothetical protein